MLRNIMTMRIWYSNKIEKNRRNFLSHSRKGLQIVCGWCQDGIASSRTVPEVKQLELNQSSVRLNLPGNGECCSELTHNPSNANKYSIEAELYMDQWERGLGIVCKSYTIYIFALSVLGQLRFNNAVGMWPQKKTDTVQFNLTEHFTVCSI